MKVFVTVQLTLTQVIRLICISSNRRRCGYSDIHNNKKTSNNLKLFTLVTNINNDKMGAFVGLRVFFYESSRGIALFFYSRVKFVNKNTLFWGFLNL